MFSQYERDYADDNLPGISSFFLQSNTLLITCIFPGQIKTDTSTTQLINKKVEIT